MRPVAHALCGLLALGALRVGLASDVYKCTTPQGDVAFQDRPCAAGATQSQVWLPDSAPAPQAAPVPATGDASQPPPPPAPPPALAQLPLPPLWICRKAEDGSTYFSQNGTPPVRYVPLGVLGVPGKSLAQAYGPGGIGVSAPGVRQTPIDASPQAAIGADYTPLQDTCARATRAQTCTYLRQQAAQTDAALGKARFKDERATLQPRADELQAQLGGC